MFVFIDSANAVCAATQVEVMKINGWKAEGGKQIRV